MHDRPSNCPAWAGPRWLGGFPFEETSTHPDDPPGAWFVLPKTQWVQAPDGRTYETTVEAGPAEQDAPSAPASTQGARETSTQWASKPPFTEWSKNVQEALEWIRAAEIEKLVLARRIQRSLPPTFDFMRVLERLSENPDAGTQYAISDGQGRSFMGTTPELLVRVTDSEVETASIAGTRPRGTTPADDRRLEQSLLASSKDAWEHELVSRFLRNALDEAGLRWRATRERSVLKLPNVQHLETRFNANVLPTTHAVDVAARMHPTPAVAGSPRKLVLRLIRQLEGKPRGWYAGAVGWFDSAGRGEFSVAIRGASFVPGRATLFAGCGLVNGSNPLEEWEESREKLSLLQRVVDGVLEA